MELLFKAVDASHADPLVDAGCYKRGDFVIAFDNGHTWGTEELLPPAQGGKFARIVISDVTVDQFKNFVRNKWLIAADDGETEDVNTEGRIAQRFVRRRRLHIRVADLPANVRNQLNNNGVFTTTWAAVREYVREKVSGTTAQGDAI